MDTRDLIARVVGMEVFLPVFEELRLSDSESAGAIVTALRGCVAEMHAGLTESDIGPDRIRYLLLREAVEVKAQASAFLNYEREMGSREAALWQFALGITEKFFNDLGDALDSYFQVKAQAIVEEVENDASWYTGLADTAKKGGAIVNAGAQYLKKGAAGVSEWLFGKSADGAIAKVKEALDYLQRIPDEDVIDTRDVVRRAIEKHMPRATLVDDIQKILSEAARCYQDSWQKEIRTQTPDLSTLQAFAAGASGRLPEWATFELGTAEQTLAVGLGGAAVAAASLAAGWHVLAYAMVHVFYPVAIAAALASLGVAFLTKEKSQQARRKNVREAIEECHRHFLLVIDLGISEELGGKTLRQSMIENSRTVVMNTLEAWRKAISGNLTLDHYRKLSAAATAHLQLIQECMSSLSVAPSEIEKI